MIVKKYILTETCAITTRDISLNNSINQCLFDTEEELLQYANNKYYPNTMQIALVEGEVYGESWCKQFRDIRELCGFRKYLEDELRKFRELEFKQMMRVANELTNKAEKLESDYYKLQCEDKYV